jgi:polynucleotide 5'-kinase involved in rRNA processing
MVLRESPMAQQRPASSAAIVGPSSVPLEPNRRRRTFSRPDAFESVTLPPPNESEHERSARVLKEREAKAVSDGIDAQLHRDKNNQKKRREVKVLLLGQSESGKSTTLKRESFVRLDYYSRV